MSTRRGTRYNIMRGGILAGAILSFIPAFALVKAQASGSSGDDGAPAAAPSRSVSDARQTLPSSNQPSTNQSVSPSQTQSRNTLPVQPRVRTRAS